MNGLKNPKLVNLIDEILKDPGDSIPEESRESLMDCLSRSFVICPVNNDGTIGYLRMGPHTFIPACCDIEDFNRIFKDETPRVFEFAELSQFVKIPVDGIMINPGSSGFIVNSSLAWMTFNRIADKNRPPVEKGYDVKVRLRDFRPIHWRDLIIPENITFYELDDILKTLWGCNGHHLSMFKIKEDNILIMDEIVADACMIHEFYNSRITEINSFFEKYKKISYFYDFGDDWTFDIEIKKTVDYDKNYVTIKRFKGKYNIFEDCGGIYGLSEIIYYSEHPDEYDEWYSERAEYLCEFDMEYAQELLKIKDYVRRLHE
jgi:hypothetical protein